MNNRFLFWLLIAALLISLRSLEAQTLRWQRTIGECSANVMVCGTAVFARTCSGSYRSTDSGNTWIRLVDFPGGVLAGSGTMIVVRGQNFMEGVFRSSDAGDSWTQAKDSGMRWNDLGGGLAVSQTTIFSGDDGDWLDGVVQRSTDWGDSWTQVLRAGSAHFDAIVATARTIFAAESQSDSLMYRSLDNGDSWDRVFTAEVSALFLNGTTVLAGTKGGRVYLSTNNGDTWTQSADRLPAKVRAIVASRMTIFAGTDSGVYFSTNSGYTWTLGNAGLPGSTTYSIAIIGTTLFAGTDSGAYCADISSLQSEVSDHQTISQSLALSVQPNPAHDEFRVSYNSANAEIELYDLLGKRVMSARGDESGVTKFDVSALSAGLYVLRLRSGVTMATQTVIIVH